MELELPKVHESIMAVLLSKLDCRSKCALMCTCRFLHELLSQQEQWQELVFDEDGEGCVKPCGANDLFRLLNRSHGACMVLQLGRSEEARQAEGQQRFSNGYKYDQVLPHTMGLRALALVAMCPNLRHLAIDERASCVGGMTNDLAKALATHCKKLMVLEIFFQRYSLPSELFTDEGLIALSGGCRMLQKLALHNCDRISDRSMYALAANCPNLQSITVGGYNEHVTDGGMTVLFEACKQLHYVRLSSKLLKVTDTSGATLASSCPSLTHVKLTKAMTDSTLLRLSLSCKLLQEVDMHRCKTVTCDALQLLLASCPALERLVLPQQIELDDMVQQLPRCSLSMLEEQQLQVLALHH